MKVRSQSPVSPPSASAAAPLVRPTDPPERRPDDVHLSVASAGLNQTDKISNLTAAVGAGTYTPSSEATSHALVEDALLKPL